MSSITKIRLDKLLFDKGLVESREKAKALILAGEVMVNGMKADKAGMLASPDDALEILKKMPYVSRGGLKLKHAIDTFGIDLKEKIAMDIGASTGGFTDCLLQHGAKKVYAIDVGYGQIDLKLRNDARVAMLEKTNIRYLDKNAVPDIIDVTTIDVSFISLLKVLPKALEFLKESGEVIALIKPQFEVERKDVRKGGVVRDEAKRNEVIEKIKAAVKDMGLEVKGLAESPVRGPKGNVEFLIYLTRTY
jgi:23S rRNA (cytidine1920-2'-O)/16S rRNA (cytidine1409-2'-O)-methyltransferase